MLLLFKYKMICFSYLVIFNLFLYFQPKPDMLQLKQPCNVSDIRFFNNNKLVVSHRHGVVNIYLYLIENNEILKNVFLLE